MQKKGVIERWKEYQERTATGKPRPLLVEALPFVSQGLTVLDLGGGALNDAQLLLNGNFKEVVVVDMTPQFKKLDIPTNARFEYFEGDFRDYLFSASRFDLISSQFSLPFSGPESFLKVWEDVVGSLKPGGIFSGQLFGTEDGWKDNSFIVFHTKDEVEKLLKGFSIIKLEEKKYKEKMSRGKYWHYFDIIAKKD